MIAPYLQGRFRIAPQLCQKAPLIVHFRRRHPDWERHSQIVGKSQGMGLLQRPDGIQPLRRRRVAAQV